MTSSFWVESAPVGAVWPVPRVDPPDEEPDTPAPAPAPAPEPDPEPPPEPDLAAAQELLDRHPDPELDDDSDSGGRATGGEVVRREAPRGNSRPAPLAPGARYDWSAIKKRYVEGVKDPDTGIVEWPSLDAAAAAYGAPGQRARERSAAEGWVEARRRWQATVEQQRQKLRANAIAKEATNLEGKALDTAKLGLQLVFARLTEIGQAAQRRRSEAGPGGAASGIDAQEQQRLAAAADLWHRIGLRALGDPEVTRVELTGAAGGPIEIAQELRRDDPTRLAGVLSVLRQAGIDDIVGGDVVDADVVDEDAGAGAGAT